LAQKLSVVVRR